MIRQPLYGVPPPHDVHERNTRNFAHAPPELAVARRDDVAAAGGDALDEAVVGVGALVRAREALEARVAGDARGRAE